MPFRIILSEEKTFMQSCDEIVQIFNQLYRHADTDIKGNKKARQINGLVNEWYLEDLSENIRAVLDNKRKNGKFIGSFPAYGYSKDPNDRNHLIIDEEAADVVRKIFMLAAAGYGKQNIADRLNAMSIPNPTKYKELKGYSYVNGGAGGNSGLWNRSTVGRILGNETYTGMLVQGRRRKASYKNHKIFDLPREEWIRVAGTHEAIVDMDLFLSVQSIPDGGKRTFQAVNSYKLAGKVRCMECGALMKKISSVYKGDRREYLKCGGCERQTIRYDLLEGLVQEKLVEYYYRYCGGQLSVLPDAARLLISSIEVSKKVSPSHEQEVYINWLF
jgi:hypothetical protein